MPVPRGGLRLDLPQQEVPDGFVVDGTTNVLERFGMLTNRPGLQPVNAARLGGRISGGIYFKTPTGAQKLVAADLTAWYSVAGSTWTNISSDVVTFAATAANPTRFTTFPSGTSTVIIGVNGVNAPYQWGGSGTVALLTGAPSGAKDVTVVANRIIFGNVTTGGMRAPSRIVPSDFNDQASYTATNIADMSDTPDDIVAVRAFQRTQFAIYKTESVWVGIGQPGAFPFAYENVSIGLPGPVSPAAVVRVGGSHYYLGTDGQVYVFNGYQVQPISDPLGSTVQNGINASTQGRAFGLYSRADRCVWFFYPAGTSVDPNAAVCVNLVTNAWWAHTFPFTLSTMWTGDDLPVTTWASLSGRTWADLPAVYPTWASFGGSQQHMNFAGDTLGRVHRYGYGYADAGQDQTVVWVYPLRAWVAPNQMHTLDAIESAFAETLGGPTLTIGVATSAAAAEMALDYAPFGTHDTTLRMRQLLPAPASSPRPRGQWLGVRFSGTSAARVEYRGSTAYVYSENLA